MSYARLIPETRPISDLRTHLADIEASAKNSGAPIVLTRNGTPSLVVMDSDAYNESIQRERHIRLLREAEIEAKYRAEAIALDESRARLDALRETIGASHA